MEHASTSHQGAEHAAPSSHKTSATPRCAMDPSDLPSPCRQLMLRYMDRFTRSAWRLVNRQARMDVFEYTTSLTWVERNRNDALSKLHACSKPGKQRRSKYKRPMSLPHQLLAKSPGVRRLTCRSMALLKSLQGLPTNLHALDLRGKMVITDFSPLLRCPSLRELTLHTSREARHQHQRDNIANMRLSALCGTLKQLTTLQRLRVSGTAWHIENTALLGGGLADLAHALALLPGLKHLDLSGLWMKDVGMLLLCPILAGPLSGLTHLRLADNDLSYESMELLAPTLAGVTSLFRLDVSGNRFGPEGVELLAPVLAGLLHLGELDVSCNELGRFGAAALAHVVGARAATLRWLNVEQSNMGRRSLAPLQAAVNEVPGLTLLVSPNDKDQYDEWSSDEGEGGAASGEDHSEVNSGDMFEMVEFMDNDNNSGDDGEDPW